MHVRVAVMLELDPSSAHGYVFIRTLVLAMNLSESVVKTTAFILHVNFKFCHVPHSALGAVARSNAHFGQGTGPILRDRVACTGREARLRDCRFFNPDFFDSHVEDAGVQCTVFGE